MKGKKEVIGIIPKETIFQATKERHTVRFSCGAHGAQTPPREKFSPLDYDASEWGEEDCYD